VTLRACSTGVQGQVNQGDEFGGLMRSLLYAGAGAVVATLWNVDQRSSRDFLEAMYCDIAGGKPAWQAIWSAQRALLGAADQPYLAHPYHWAPLVLVGDWR
jgi:CHAT domain-containing protein